MKSVIRVLMALTAICLMSACGKGHDGSDGANGRNGAPGAPGAPGSGSPATFSVWEYSEADAYGGADNFGSGNIAYVADIQMAIFSGGGASLMATVCVDATPSDCEVMSFFLKPNTTNFAQTINSNDHSYSFVFSGNLSSTNQTISVDYDAAGSPKLFVLTEQ